MRTSQIDELSKFRVHTYVLQQDRTGDLTTEKALSWHFNLTCSVSVHVSGPTNYRNCGIKNSSDCGWLQINEINTDWLTIQGIIHIHL